MGNPGPEYEATRHNYGFFLVNRLCDKWRTSLTRATPHALFEVVRRGQQEIVLAKPIDYMNRSGVGVRELLVRLRATPDRLIVAHDDLDLELGTVKMRRNGGPGGHNGVASVVDELGTRDFGRIRMGIGPRPPDWSGTEFVLSRFEEREAVRVDAVLNRAVDGIEALLARGFAAAMNRVNRKPPERDSREGE